MFSDKEFVDGANVDLSSGSTAAATADIGTAVTVVGKKRVGNSAVQRTSVTDKPWKQDWIKGIASGPIVSAWQNVPLWIKVPPTNPHRAESSLRCIVPRIWPEKPANQCLKTEGFTIMESPVASSAVVVAGS
jgi:hypothetical protein